MEILGVFFSIFLVEKLFKEKDRRDKVDSAAGVKLWRSLIQEYARHGGSVCFG
jgi:hypothetical protein